MDGGIVGIVGPYIFDHKFHGYQFSYYITYTIFDTGHYDENEKLHASITRIDLNQAPFVKVRMTELAN